MRRSHKAIDDTGVGDSGGSRGLDGPTGRMRRGFKPGTNARDKQNAGEQRAKKSLKAIPEGSLIDKWCRGQSHRYK